MPIVNAPFELKEHNESTGKFVGEVAVYGNVDLGRDVIEPGAFKKMDLTSDGYLRIAAYHDTTKFVGKAKVMDTDKSMILEGQLEMGLSYARDIYIQMQAKILDSLSVGFNILKNGAEIKDGIRYIKSAILKEGSIVPFGMNPLAKITEVKQYEKEDIRILERIAKHHGCTKTQALAIVRSFKDHLSASGIHPDEP